MMRGNRSLQKQNGQTLIEALVTLGVAVIIITSIVTLANKSNARATNARQATQASKLAQEGLEIIRNIRDVNHNQVVRAGRRANPNSNCSTAPNYCAFYDLYSRTQINPVTAHLSHGCVAGQWCLLAGTPASPDPEAGLLGIFTRTVELRDDDLATGHICGDLDLGFDEIKRVTVIVTWGSPLGTQNKTATSCLTNL